MVTATFDGTAGLVSREPRPLPSASSDENLARRAAMADPEAFDIIFGRYERPLYRYCLGLLREPQDAQDALQNAMIRVMRALPGETREMQLKPWLYRIAHNEAVELRRRERSSEALNPSISDSRPRPEERAEQDDRLHTLLADLADLPERQRARVRRDRRRARDISRRGTPGPLRGTPRPQPDGLGPRHGP